MRIEPGEESELEIAEELLLNVHQIMAPGVQEQGDPSREALRDLPDRYLMPSGSQIAATCQHPLLAAGLMITNDEEEDLRQSYHPERGGFFIR